MKKSIIALLIAVPLSMGLSGCVVKIGDDREHVISSDFEEREFENRKKIAHIALNSSFNDVQNNLGVADFTESYQNAEQTIQVLYYRTQRIRKDGLTTKDECSKLTFVDGQLESIGIGK